MTRPPAGRAVQDADAPRDGKITREVVLATALEIIDRDGADGLSMRRLARALDRDPMLLYRHAPNKAALLDGVTETVLAQLEVDPADPDWAGQLRAVARDYRALALAHPNVVPLLVTRPLATPLALRPLGTLRPLEDVLALLTRAGFSGADALHIYRALFGFLHGHVLNELQELVDNPDETDDLLRLGLHRLPIGEFPLLRGLAPVLAAYDGAAELERGLDILLAGLATTLPPPDGARPSSRAVHPASRPAPHRPDTKGVRKAGASPEPTEDLSRSGLRRCHSAAVRPYRARCPLSSRKPSRRACHAPYLRERSPSPACRDRPLSPVTGAPRARGISDKINVVAGHLGGAQCSARGVGRGSRESR
jgi:AcrR family transcriptional regulator